MPEAPVDGGARGPGHRRALGRSEAHSRSRAGLSEPSVTPCARPFESTDAVASQSPAIFSDDEEDLEDAIADDEYVDVDGVVRPKGLGVHNSLINWTNKAVPLGQTV